MTTPDVEQPWYNALFEEDCLQVKNLLMKNPELLKVGWSSDDNRNVKGSLDNHWKPLEEKKWMGRTTLHVGARRGDIELVEQVLFLCGGIQKHWGIVCDRCGMLPILRTRFKSLVKPDFDLRLRCFEASGADEEDYAQMSGDNPFEVSYAEYAEISGVSAADEEEYAEMSGSRVKEKKKRRRRKENAEIADKGEIYAETGFPSQARITATWRKPAQRANLTPDAAQKNSLPAADVGNKTPSLENSSGNSGPGVSQQGNGGDEERPMEIQEKKRIGNDIAGSSYGGFKLASEGGQQTIGESDRALQIYKAHVNRERIVSRLLSKKEITTLLLSKDGEYKLEALAMAALQGNADIIDLLLDAIGKCDNPPDYMPNYRRKSSAQVPNRNDRTQRIELTAVTKKVIASVREDEPEFMAACEEEYSRHRDFNFLALEEYLFHFSWTSRFAEVFHYKDKEILLESFWSMVRPWPDAEEELHQQEKPEKRRPDAEEKAEKPEKKNPDALLMLWHFLFNLHDGQGRTPFHVALDEGTHESFILKYLDICRDLDEIKRATLDCAVTALDGSGKAPAHRAAATIQMTDYRYFGGPFNWLEVSKGVFSDYPEATMDKIALGKLSASNGFRSGGHCFTPLHAAILHNDTSFGEGWCDLWSLEEACKQPYQIPVSDGAVNLDVMQLVCISRADIK